MGGDWLAKLAQSRGCQSPAVRTPLATQGFCPSSGIDNEQRGLKNLLRFEVGFPNMSEWKVSSGSIKLGTKEPISSHSLGFTLQKYASNLTSSQR